MYEKSSKELKRIKLFDKNAKSFRIWIKMMT